MSKILVLLMVCLVPMNAMAYWGCPEGQVAVIITHKDEVTYDDGKKKHTTTKVVYRCVDERDADEE